MSRLGWMMMRFCGTVILSVRILVLDRCGTGRRRKDQEAILILVVTYSRPAMTEGPKTA